MTIQIINYSGSDYTGWLRVTTDHDYPEHQYGSTDNGELRFRMGHDLGLDAKAVDVYLTLQRGERREIVLGGIPKAELPTTVPTLDPIAYFGGKWIVGLSEFGGWKITPTLVGYDFECSVRISEMLNVDLRLTVYNGQGWAKGEVWVTASNADGQQPATVIPFALWLYLGNSIISIPGLQVGAPFLHAGETIASGQCRRFPFTVAWPHLLKDEVDHVSAMVASQPGGLCWNGIRKLYPNGNPKVPEGFDSLAWSRSMMTKVIADLHNWNGALGQAKDSRNSGGKDDQGWPGHECLGRFGLGAEQVFYYGALSLAKRPCHHLEDDGSLLRLSEHPDLAFWNGLPHSAGPRFSPDRLGLPTLPTLLDTNGWYGPDEQHWFFNAVAIAYKLTGSPALQNELEHQARLFLFQCQVDPRWSVSRMPVSRAVGWEGIVAVHLWRLLEDRALAERVKAREINRIRMLFLPTIARHPGKTWGITNASSWAQETGRPLNWSPYQVSVGAYGLHLASREFGIPEGVEVAVETVRWLMERACDDDGKFWSTLSIDPNQPDALPQLVQGAGAGYGVNTRVWGLPAFWIAKMNGIPRGERFYNDYVAWQRGGGRWVPAEEGA